MNFRQRKEKIDEIRYNLHESIFELVVNVPRLGLEFDSRENWEKAQKIVKLGKSIPKEVPEEYSSWVQDLWLDHGVRMCYNRSNEFQIIDNAK